MLHLCLVPMMSDKVMSFSLLDNVCLQFHPLAGAASRLNPKSL